MRMRSLPARTAPVLLGLLLAVSGAAARAQATGPNVTFDIKDGATVADTTPVVAHVTVDDQAGIDKVEFAVDGQAQSTDTSVPYTFDWDTLQVAEGDHTITVTATDEKGRTGKATLAVKVDNELTRGADYLGKTALDALKANDADKAGRYARRALKVDPGNLLGARAMAGLYRARGDINQALAALDKAKIPDDDTEARAELAALHIARGEASANMGQFVTEAQTAIDLYRKVQAARLAARKDTGDATADATARGDILFAVRDYAGALTQYQKIGSSDTLPAPVSNRICAANLNAVRARDANIPLRLLALTNRSDDTAKVLAAAVAFQLHQIDKARADVRDSAAAGFLPALIVGSSLEIAVNKPEDARKLIERAAAAAPNLPEVHLLNAFVAQQPLDAQKEIAQALEVNPTLTEAYLLRAYLQMFVDDPKRMDAVNALLDLALKNDPKNLNVQLFKAAALLEGKQPNEAMAILNEALKTDRNAADIHQAMAVAYSQLDKPTMVTQEMKNAFKLDPDHWGDDMIPTSTDLAARIFRYRFWPSLSPDALYSPTTAGSTP